jgi:hypothetical protein
MGLFGKKDKDGESGGGRMRLTDPAMLRRKGVLGRARILSLESKPSVGGSIADPAYQCTFKLQVELDGEAPFEANVQQRMVRSALASLTGDGVIAPAWVDPKDRSKVAIDIAAGPIENSPSG